MLWFLLCVSFSIEIIWAHFYSHRVMFCSLIERVYVWLVCLLIKLCWRKIRLFSRHNQQYWFEYTTIQWIKYRVHWGCMTGRNDLKTFYKRSQIFKYTTTACGFIWIEGEKPNKLSRWAITWTNFNTSNVCALVLGFLLLLLRLLLILQPLQDH